MPKILLIEDHKMVARALGLVLQAHYQVMFAHNMQQMREKLANEKFDLLLLDMKMEDGNSGAQYLHYLQKFTTPILVVAAAITDVELFLCYHMGAKGEISKSLDEKELITATSVLLNGKRAYTPTSLRRIEAFKQKMPKLTPRFLSILVHFFADEHKTDADIAEHESLEVGTVKNYVSYVVKSFAAVNRRELTEKLRAFGFTAETLVLVYSYLAAPSAAPPT